VYASDNENSSVVLKVDEYNLCIWFFLGGKFLFFTLLFILHVVVGVRIESRF
jgi:hypothetical protein